jgi:hypothetical protein
MTRFFLYIKHRLPFLWRWIEYFNGLVFCILYRKRMRVAAQEAIDSEKLQGFRFKILEQSNSQQLAALLAEQPPERLAHFKPHGFDVSSIARQANNPAFLMFGAFSDQRLVGYFFLRCFANRRCFVGRMIDHRNDRLGIGRAMNRIMYQTAWNSGFRVFTTVSKENQMVIRSHSRNPAARIIKELPNNYLLIEFLRDTTEQHS